MNILDENLPESQRIMLRARRISVRQIGYEAGHKGMKDAEIIPLLHKMNCPTFFTRDEDFYDRGLCHERFCLVHLDVDEEMVGEYIQRFLRHRAFNTKAKRMGCVIRVMPTKLVFWRGRHQREQYLPWQ